MITCIIGCTGYLGSKISSQLHREGHKVIGVCRKFPKNNKIFKNIFFKIIEGDITNPKFHQKIFLNTFSSLIYTVSLNHKISEKNLSNSIKINCIPLLNICNNIVRNNLNVKIVYFSTIKVYGNYNKEKIITEKTKKNPKNIYSLTHSMCEDILEIFSKFNGLKSTSLRLTNGYGYPELKSCKCWWLILNDLCLNAKKKNKIIINSNGSLLRDFIHISDIALAVQKLLSIKKESPRVMNLCSGKTLSMLEIANIIQKKTSMINKIPILYVKGRLIDKKNLIKKIKSIKNKNRFKISNKEMKKLNIVPKIDILKGIEKTLLDIAKNKNQINKF
jgi:nucleoside-diphosphate-sugar epimerase